MPGGYVECCYRNNVLGKISVLLSVTPKKGFLVLVQFVNS